MRSRRGLADRDQGVSAFSAILGRLGDATGATAVALVDGEGETVDYAGSLTPFAVKIMAAEFAIVLRRLTASRDVVLAASSHLTIRAQDNSYSVHALSENYGLVLQLPRRSFRVSLRAVAEAVREICREAELPLPLRFFSECWARVEIQEQQDRSRRPSALWLNGKWWPVQVLGQYKSLQSSRREIGFRAQLATGEEITLVRESLGLWFIDDSSSHGAFR